MNTVISICLVKNHEAETVEERLRFLLTSGLFSRSISMGIGMFRLHHGRLIILSIHILLSFFGWLLSLAFHFSSVQSGGYSENLKNPLRHKRLFIRLIYQRLMNKSLYFESSVARKIVILSDLPD